MSYGNFYAIVIFLKITVLLRSPNYTKSTGTLVFLIINKVVVSSIS